MFIAWHHSRTFLRERAMKQSEGDDSGDVLSKAELKVTNGQSYILAVPLYYSRHFLVYLLLHTRVTLLK